MTANDNVLLAADPTAREVLLGLIEGCQDLREATARLTERALNALMSLQADEACGARWGERSEGRVNSRNGYRERPLATAAGDVTLEIPKLRRGSYFPERILARWSRADAALAAAVAEVYVNGVATRKVEAVAEALGVSSMSKDQVSRICADLDAEVGEFRCRPLDDRRYCYLWLDATWVRCRVSGRSVSQAVVTAIALGDDGRKHFVGLDLVDTESREDWLRFLRSLRSRGISGVVLVVSDACPGLSSAVAEVFPGAAWQRCVTHLMRDVRGHVHNRADQARATELMKAVFRQGDRLVAHACLRRAADGISSFCPAAGRCLAEAGDAALTYLAFPAEHRAKIRTNNVQERANREIKRRYREVQSFPSRESLVRLVGAVLVEEEDAWAQQRTFSEASVARAWDARDEPVPTELELRAADRRAEAVIADALDRAAGRK